MRAKETDTENDSDTRIRSYEEPNKWDMAKERIIDGKVDEREYERCKETDDDRVKNPSDGYDE